MNYEALGRRIHQQRKLQHLTQEALARAAQVSTSYIGHIERGLKQCSLETLLRICAALKVTPDFLLQDSIQEMTAETHSDLSAESRSMLNDIANVLREYDRK